jgi:hypothetical protein
MRKTILRLLLVATALAAAACGQTAGPASPDRTAAASGMTSTVPDVTGTPSASDPGATEATGSAPPVPADTVWLCRPGLVPNPCQGDLSATVVAADGSKRLEPAAPAADPAIDCFYVYPTVSRQKTVNATLAIDPEERAVAAAQAARFSQVCRVYAPMYPQLTLAGISDPSKINLVNALSAYEGVAAAFTDYMANYNKGRGVVFIGHSQGAIMLRVLVKSEVDGDTATRRQLVSALLIGGNVVVPKGKTVGGDFMNIPGCESAAQIGCVVAYSSFDKTPPANALFGRADSPLTNVGNLATTGEAVLCVNPAAPGGSGALKPYFPTQNLSTLLGSSAARPTASAATPFVAYPGEYSAQCQTSGALTWLQVTRTAAKSDKRPALAIDSAPTWGLHTVDVNIALGNLVEMVRTETAAYLAK